MNVINTQETNSGCLRPPPHPPQMGIPEDWELEQKGNLGVLRAAQRKLWHELGIVASEVPLDKFHFITRIHYRALDGSLDGIWGEHESALLLSRPALLQRPEED